MDRLQSGGANEEGTGNCIHDLHGKYRGVIGSNIYIEDDSPKYPTGFGVLSSFTSVGVLACFLLEFLYSRINRRGAAMTKAEIRAKYSDANWSRWLTGRPFLRYSL